MIGVMRKRLGVLAALFAVCMLAGCGEDADVSLNQMKVEKYVTLGDYKNLAVSVEKTAVSDEECDQLLLAVYQSNVTRENGGIVNRPVEDGDIANIDYVGTKDGVAFGGGTASGTNLEIGSGSLIPGFESGLIGVMPGETKELNLTFPEDYKNNAELAGQAVVFSVTVNFIQPGMEELQDSVVAALDIDGVSNVQELRLYVHDYLDRNAQQQYIYDVQDAIMMKLAEDCTIGELPESYLEGYRQLYRNTIEKSALSMNTTPDMYTNYFYGMDSEDYAFLYGEIQARQELMLQAIANQEGWAVGDDELAGLINDFALENGYLSVEELEAEVPREQLRNYFMSEKVMEHLVEQVTGAPQSVE